MAGSALSPTRPTDVTWFRRIVWLARDIKLSHSVFALPFALLATVLAAGRVGRLPTLLEYALIVLCMVLARTYAMAMNRRLDAAIDARNPRTAGRAIPSGRLTPRFVSGAAAACAIAFLVACAGFWLARDNPWPVLLGPLVLAYLGVYGLTKRFTAACHLWLGGALAASPLAATIAIEPVYLNHVAPYALAMMVLCWVAGFDILYALQDLRVDREQRLFSMPARFGVPAALGVSRLLHAVAIAALLLAWRFEPLLGPLFLIATLLTAALLLVEHVVVHRSFTRHIGLAFFTLNGVVSVLLAAAGIADALA